MSAIFTQQLENQLLGIAAFLENDIKEILLEKGHNSTGELVKSIKNVVRRGSDSFTIEGSMAIQGRFVISGRERGAKGVPIDALVEWIENKGFADSVNGVRGVAFAIQKTIKEKGIKADDFIGEVFEKRAARITNKLNNIVKDALEASLTNLVNNSKKFA